MRVHPKRKWSVQRGANIAAMFNRTSPLLILNVLVSQSLVSFDTSLGRDFFPPLLYDPLCGRLLLVTLRKRWDGDVALLPLDTLSKYNPRPAGSPVAAHFDSHPTCH